MKITPKTVKALFTVSVGELKASNGTTYIVAATNNQTGKRIDLWELTERWQADEQVEEVKELLNINSAAMAETIIKQGERIKELEKQCGMLSNEIHAPNMEY